MFRAGTAGIAPAVFIYRIWYILVEHRTLPGIDGLC